MEEISTTNSENESFHEMEIEKLLPILLDDTSLETVKR